MKMKRILKIITGIIIFFTLPSLLFFGFLYLKYNEDLPTGLQGKQADALATKMLNALNYEAFKTTDFIAFTFKKRHHYEWNKEESTCEVYWKNFRVHLDLNNKTNSRAFENNQEIENEEIIQKALDYFNNDTFWLVAPYKVFDQGTERRLVKTEDNRVALLVTYTAGGSTPGDSFLWFLDDTGKPTRFKMWTSILPLDGIEASWNNWTTTETGAELPNFHKILFLGLEIENIKTIN